MSTPPGFKNLWKNVAWSNKDEKLAFFNHYFKRSSMVNNRIESQIKEFKDDLLMFIEKNEIVEKNNKRPVTIEDIINRIKSR